MRPRLSLPFALAVVLTLALSVSARPAHADDAQDHYTSGRESYRVGLYGRALEEFSLSLSLAPSPNTRLYIARTLRELGRWAEANEQYTKTVTEAEQRGGRYLATRDAATIELADVKQRLASAKHDEKEATPAPSPPPPPPSPSAPPPPPATAGPTTVTWISGAVAVTGAASFALLYGLAANRYGYLEDNCARVRTSSCDDARTTGRTEELAAYSSLGVAVVAAAITVYSLVTAPPKKEPWRVAF